jgi:hypothetical protein
MLVDPLSDNPIVVTGSVSFSDASTRTNDENMLIIKGNTRVADIYLGEYMRLYSHYAFGETVNIFLQNNPCAKPEDMKQGFLIEGKDWTTTYFDLDDKAHGAPLIFWTSVPPTARPGDSEIPIGFKAPPPADCRARGVMPALLSSRNSAWVYEAVRT